MFNDLNLSKRSNDFIKLTTGQSQQTDHNISYTIRDGKNCYDIICYSWSTNYITSIEEIILQDLLVIRKRTLQNY